MKTASERVSANSRKAADNPAHQENRKEHRDQRDADRQHGKSNFPRAGEGRLEALRTRIGVAGYIFEHHDRIVDHEAGRDREGHQRQIVQAKVHEIHRAKSAYDRNQHGDAWNDRGTNIAQEQEDNQRDQENRDGQGPFGVMQRGADRSTAIGGGQEFDIVWHRRLEMRQFRLHALDRVDDVGAGLPENDRENGGAALGQAQVAHVLDRVQHVGDVGETNRSAIAVGNDEGRIIGGPGRLIVGVNLEMPFAVLDRAFRAVGVGGGERRAHVLKADAIFGQGVRVELDAHRGQGTPENENLTDAIKLGKPLLEDIAGEIIHLTARLGLRRHGEDKDRRVGRIDLAIGRIGGQIGGQIGARCVDRRLDVARGAVDVAADVELEDNAGLSEGACRGHFRDMGDLAEVAFERACQARCHGIRTRAGKLRLHQDRWKIDLRKRRDRQLQKRRAPGKRNPQGKERGRHRTRDERRGEVHP